MFKSDKVVFRKLSKLPIVKRMEVARSDAGPSILSAMTPSQLAELFPRYYQQALPDIGGFNRATTEAARKAQSEASESLLDRLTRAEKGLEQYVSDKYHDIKRKLGFDTKAAASLTPEQEAAWNKVMSGAVDVNSAEGKLFGRLSDSQLSSLGLSRSKDNTGRDVFQYAAPDVTRQEAESRMKTSGSGGNRFFDSIIRAEGTGKYGDPYNTSLGYMKSPKPLTDMTMREALDWGDQVRKAQGMNSSAKGAFQIVNTTQLNAMKSLGIGMDEKFSPENQRKMAAWIVKQQGLGAWEGFKVHPEERQNATSAMQEGLHNQFATAVKPEGPNGQYSEDQINKMMVQLRDEKNSARKQQLANLLTDAGVDTATVNSISSVNTSGVTGEHFGESKQCVALTKHFAPNVGPASSWQFHEDTSGIVPGAAIATTTYGKGATPGGRMASQMPDGQSHYHTGIALTKPDADGNVLILDQSAGKGSSITKINIHHYHGEQWRPIKGGEPNDKSMQAVNIALGRANDSEKAAIMESMRGAVPKTPTSTPEVKTVAEGTPPVKPVDQEGRPIAEQPTPGETKPAPTATVVPPGEAQKSEPAPPPNRYTVDRAGFINAIKNTEEFKNTMFSSLASDQQIIDGFNADPKVQAAGVRYDAEKGIMHFKDPNHPDVKAVMQDLHTDKFMTPIQEKKAPPPEKKVEAPPPKPSQPSQQPTLTPGEGTSPAQQPTMKPGEGTSPAQQPAPQRQSALEAQPMQEIPEIPGASDGGSFGVNGDVQFYPMDKRDNLAAVDTKTQKPLFTAKSGERIDVTPQQKVKNEMGPTDNGLKGEFEALHQKMDNTPSNTYEPPKQVFRQSQGERITDATFGDRLQKQNEKSQWMNPTIERAMHRTSRIQESGDGLNNHFSNGNTNYG